MRSVSLAIVSSVFVGLATITAASGQAPGPASALVPTGTVMKVVLVKQLASNSAKAGDLFQFRAIDDVVVGGIVIVKKDSVGSGTVKLAGAAGGHGHEGDLTLDFDTIAGPDGNVATINSELQAQGKNQKTASWMMGGALVGSAIKGSELSIATEQVIDLVFGAKAKLEPAPKATSTSSH